MGRSGRPETIAAVRRNSRQNARVGLREFRLRRLQLANRPVLVFGAWARRSQRGRFQIVVIRQLHRSRRAALNSPFEVRRPLRASNSFRSGSNELHRVTIDHSPFRIGRCETSDLQIDSVQVSREHAQIYQRGNIWAIRDLGSTNGTQVNGKPVRESFLSDGDILAIAETEVTFVASSVTPFQRMATQPIQPRESTKAAGAAASRNRRHASLTEATLWQAIPLELATVVSLVTGEVEACFAQLRKRRRTATQTIILIALHAVGRHYRELARRRAIELAQPKRTAKRLFRDRRRRRISIARTHCFPNSNNCKIGLRIDCELGVIDLAAEIPRSHRA